MKTVILTINLCLASLILQAQIPPGYYDGTTGLTGAPLKAALNTIIKGHTEYPYSSSSTDTWDILKEADRDPNNANNVIGLYSGFSMDGPAEYDNGDGWTREHVWAKSRGDFGTSLGAGTDLHHLRAEDASTNSARSNRNFAEASIQYIDASGQYSGTTQSYTGGSNDFTWEPRASVKGDVARMIFYMAVRYEGENGEPDLELTENLLSSTDNSPLHGRLSDLLNWHTEDPVDDAERNRNDIIYGYQNNRNPFIDHPEFVAEIWGNPTPQGPSFDSTPITTATENVSYSYTVNASGGQGTLTLSATVLPSWLSFVDNGNGNGSLSGTPTATAIGANNVTLQVTDGTDTDNQNFVITVSAQNPGGGNATDLLFSEYIEGSSYNKALEIANFTGSSVDLSIYQIKKQTNGAGSWSSGLSLSGSLDDQDVYVMSHSSADATIIGQADYTGGNSELNFNGNDALGLFKNDVLIDMLGVLDDPADYAKDVTLVRNADVNAPNTTYTTAEWTSYASNTFTYIGSHTMNVTPPNQAPSVSISAPSDGAIFTEGDQVTITANASDADGTISAVEFFVNSASIGTDTTTPYEATYTVGVGSYTISAVATDDDNANTTSATISITGEMTPAAGVLYFSEYIEGSSFNKALEIANTTGSAVDLTGYTVKKQTNGAGAWSAGINLSGNLTDGEVYVLAHSSADAAILAQADHTGASTELTFNGNDAIGLFKDDVLTDIIGTFNSSAVFGQDVTMRRNDNITAPNDTYTTSEWTSFANDSFDGLGLRSGVIAPNQSPTVSITSPSDNETFINGTLINIAANASDPDGTISSVEFFVDGSSIGTDTSSPYEITYTIGIGNFAITAEATDDDQATALSSAINVIGEEVMGPSETILAYDDFENGWGNYSDGGSDAKRYTGGTYAYAGSAAINIQDNSGSSSSFTTTSSYDITGYDEVEVEFFFYPRSMENNEDFWLRYNDGSGWQTVATWVRGVDFSNNNFYVSTVTLSSSTYNFSSNAQWRFQCDASGNADDVYIDEITITGIVSGGGARTSDKHTAMAREGINDVQPSEIFSFYPNPVKALAKVQIDIEEAENTTYEILDMQGKIIMANQVTLYPGNNEIGLNLEKLEQGIYLFKMIADGEHIQQMIIKE